MGGAAGTKLLLLQFLPTFLLKNINLRSISAWCVPLLLLSCYNPQHLEKMQGVATVREISLSRTPTVQQTLVVKNSVFWKQEVIKSGM